MAKSLNRSRKFIASHFVTSYKNRNFAAVKRPKHLLRLLLALLPLAAASSVVAGPPAPPPPGVPFRYITLRLANGAALDAGKLGELHLEADALITIGTDDKRLQVPLDQVLGWDIRAEENFTTSATAVGPDRITFRVFPGAVAVEGLNDTDRVTLCDTSGHAHVLKHTDTTCALFTTDLAPGIYIIAVAGKTLKFLVP